MAESSNGLFPEEIAQLFETFSAGRLESVDKEVAYSGREVRRSRFALGGFRYYSGTTAPLNRTLGYMLRDFVRARRGTLQAFYFYPPQVEYWNIEEAGSVAAADHLDIPFRDLTLSGVQVDGTPLDFTVTEGNGPNQEAKITFTAGVQTGDVTIIGLARPRVLVRFDQDDNSYTLMNTTNFHSVWNLKFREVI